MSQLKADPTGASVGRRLGAKAQFSYGKDTVSASHVSAWQQYHRREAAKKFWGADFSTPLIFKMLS
jgi:hypothetical protein